MCDIPVPFPLKMKPMRDAIDGVVRKTISKRERLDLARYRITAYEIIDNKYVMIQLTYHLKSIFAVVYVPYRYDTVDDFVKVKYSMQEVWNAVHVSGIKEPVITTFSQNSINACTTNELEQLYFKCRLRERKHSRNSHRL